MSVTSSLTPVMVSNSCSASSKRTWVTAAPGIDDSSVRRRRLPSVWPKPGSSGRDGEPLAVALGLAEPRPSGRWMMSMGAAFASGSGACGRSGGLLGVELDDELLAHGHVDLLAQRQVAHGRPVKPPSPTSSHGGHGAVERVEVVADDDHLRRLVAQRDDVALAHLVARDRRPACR